jgi:hypothetical protein
MQPIEPLPMVAGTTPVRSRLDHASEAEDLYDMLRHPNVAGYVVIVGDPLNGRVEDLLWKDSAGLLALNTVLATVSGRLTREEAPDAIVVI